MIENYLNNHLAPHLEYFGLPADWTESIIADVRRRLVSILSRWDDLPFRYGMLVIGARKVAITARLGHPTRPGR
jgi:hypothetical protein